MSQSIETVTDSRFSLPIGWLWQGAGGPADFHKYGYDRNSNRLYKTDELYHTWDELYHADGATAGYDGLNQLTQFQRGVATDTNADGHVDTIVTGSIQTWDIDSAGNFDDIGFGGPSQDREHNRQNQITEIDDEELSYDDNGNLAWVEGFELEYRYDPWNRLIAILDEYEDGPEYYYDALGRRIVEERWEPTPVQNVRHLFYNAAWQVIHDRHPGPVADPEGEPIPTYHSFNTYYWSAAGSDTMIGRARAANNIYGQYDERLYSLQDAQGNQSALADLTGVIKERSIQTPYGDQSTYTHDRNGQIPTVYQWRYFHQGLRLDKDGDFYDNRHRFYSPTLMRFIQNDPIGLGPDPNMYRYLGNGPVSATDPSGLAPGIWDLLGDIFADKDYPAQRARERMAWKLKDKIKQEPEFQQATKLLPGGVTTDGQAMLWARRRLSGNHVDYPSDQVAVHGSTKSPEPDWVLRWFGPQEMGYGHGWNMLLAFGTIATARPDSATAQVAVPRLGPRGVDPEHHNANVMVRDVRGHLRHHEWIVSGNMTPAEQLLGFPRNTLASHSEARAIRTIPLQPGESMIITGQYPPCKTCKGVMNHASNDFWATIIYRLRENGATRTWIAGVY